MVVCFFYSADVSEGEIVEDDGGEDNSEVAKAVEAVMVAGRHHRLQGRMPREDEDIVVLESSEDDDNDEEEGIDDGNDEEGNEANDAAINRGAVAQLEDEEEPEEVMEDIVEDQESSQMQFPEQSDEHPSTATEPRGSTSDAGGNSVVPEFGEMTATSSGGLPGDSSQDRERSRYQQHAPESSVSQQGPEAQASNQFEDDREDSVVPSTPKLGDGLAHSSRGVPGSSTSGLTVGPEGSRSLAITAASLGDTPASTFVFGSPNRATNENLVSSNVSSSSNRPSPFAITSGAGPDLALQEGLDRTSVDIAQFAAHPAQERPTSETGIDKSTVPISGIVSSSPRRSAQVASASTSRGVFLAILGGVTTLSGPSILLYIH